MKVTKKACFSVCLALKTGSHEGHQFEDPFHFEDPFRMKFLSNLKQNLMKLLISKQKILRDLVFKKKVDRSQGENNYRFFSLQI